MDEYLKPGRPRRVQVVLATLAAAALMPAAALAQGMADPTRPQTDARGWPAATAAGQPGAVLQSTLISGNYAEAIISGKLVQPGGRYGDAVVLKISPGEVVLRGAQGLQTLKLFPEVEPRPADTRPAVPSIESKQVKSK